MNELITACLDNNNVLPLAEFPLNLLSKEEMKIISWVVAYASEHDVIPPPERVVKQFPEFIHFGGSFEETAVQIRRKCFRNLCAPFTNNRRSGFFRNQSCSSSPQNFQ